LAFLLRYVVISSLFFKVGWGTVSNIKVDRLLARRDLVGSSASLAALLAVPRPLLVIHATPIAPLSAPGENTYTLVIRLLFSRFVQELF
jgi:hypothetical protein